MKDRTLANMCKEYICFVQTLFHSILKFSVSIDEIPFLLVEKNVTSQSSLYILRGFLGK